MAFLYYKPFRQYMDTRAAVAQRRVEVARLRSETRLLQRRLHRSASVQELERQARELGYVKPGERLYIVKGISAWRRARHRATIARDG
jgi:Septum formation initiator